MGRTRLAQPPATAAAMVGVFRLPADLARVAERLERSRSMLALGDDWDGEGSPGYAEATWHRTAELVVDAATAHYRQRNMSPPLPIISKGDEGSIDIQWRTAHRNVLINVPAAPDEPATFYAHDDENPQRDSGGEVDAGERNEQLLVWLLA
ncbi:MAG TPA: hypothetical protein VH482_10215 [Thermomicrobiales bacterium]